MRSIHTLLLAFLPFTFGACVLSPESGAQADPSDLDGDQGERVGTAAEAVVANMFAYAPQPFLFQGTDARVLSVAQPAGFSKMIPIVQIRRYQVGDKDYAFQFSHAASGGVSKFTGATRYAPGVSYGVSNLVGGEVGVLALPSSVQAAWTSSPKRAANGQTITWPRTAFASGAPSYFRTLWTVETGTDDDFEFDSWSSATQFNLQAWGGNSSAFAEVQSVEIAPTPGLTVSSVMFDVLTGNSSAVSIPRNASKKFAVLASADSVITCAADQFSFDVDCTNGSSSSTCVVQAWGGSSGCSRVQGWMAVIESY